MWRISQCPVFSLTSTLETRFVGVGGGASEIDFRTAPEGTIFNRIFEKYIKPNPAVLLPNFREGLEKMLSSYKSAFYYETEV